MYKPREFPQRLSSMTGGTLSSRATCTSCLPLPTFGNPIYGQKRRRGNGQRLVARIMTQIAINQLHAINLCHWAKESENRLQYACVRRMQVTVDDAYRNPSGKCEKRNSQHLANS